MKKINIIRELVDIAGSLDKNIMFLEADIVDNMIKKLAWDPDEPDEGPADWYGEPSPTPETNLEVGAPVMIRDHETGQEKQVGSVTSVEEDTATAFGYASGPAIDPPEIDTAVLNITVSLTDTNIDIDDVDEFIKENVNNYEEMEKQVRGSDVEYSFTGGVVGRRPATYERIRPRY